MTDLMDRIAGLSDEQRELLRRRLQESRVARPPAAEAVEAMEPLTPTSGETPSPQAVPLSFAQVSTWFRDRLSPGNPIHNVTGGLRLEGRLRREALEAALDGIVARHQTLRARFAAPSGQPEQVIEEPFSVPMETVDLRDLPADERQARRRQLFEDELRQGFDLTRDRLLRVRLLQLEDDVHLLLFTMHHIASDGWSIGVLMSELAELYTAALESRPANLPPLAVQYGDFAAWQRRRLDRMLERSLDYWRQRLEDPPALTVLSPDRLEHGTEPEGYALGSTSFRRLDGALKHRLEALGRRHGATLFTTLLCGFLSLLQRLTGSEDVLVASPVSGRSRVEVEPLVGLFVNVVAIRVQLAPGSSFREALEITRREVLGALEHQEVPFDRLVRELKQEGAGRQVFDTLFNLTPAPVRKVELPELTVHVEPPPAMPVQFSTHLYVSEVGDDLELQLVYSERRYSRERMDTFLRQLESVLEQAVEDPDRSLASLDLVEAGSRERLPDPRQRLESPPQTTVGRSIADWIERTPERPALQHGERFVTYGELGRGAVTVARRLAAAGCRPGDAVAVLGPRAPETVVAMVGVFLARGILVPLSRELPEARLRSMVSRAGVRFLLRTGEPGEGDGWVRSAPDLQTIGLPPLAELLAADDGLEKPTDLLGPDAEIDDRAYVFFTSGSTGEPKGILGSHAGLAQFLAWQRERFSIAPEDRCAQLTGLSFDVVLRDVFAPLTAGASLVFLGGELSGSETLRRLEEQRITVLHTVPSVLETWLLDPPQGVRLAALRSMFVAGEPLTAELVDRWRRAFPQAGEIVNLYGPTETTLAKLFYVVPRTPTAGVQPVGRPIPHAQALILTADLRQCGVGEPGQIAVRTPFRSHGYLAGEAGHGDGFVVNPFTGDPGDLIYLTGDRGRYRSDGSVEFLGRIDHQVKIRGVRVEPTEIDVVLESHKSVAASAVVVREGVDGPMLVAYVVPAKDAEMDPEVLQGYLRSRLPAVMVPRAFVRLDALPLNANQKLDRAALPAPDGSRPDLASRYLAPRDAVELQLAQVWEELLDVRPVGVRDDFFALGGHSLMALHLLVRVEQRLAVKVPLGPFLQGPNIERLAEVVRRRETVARTLVPLWTADHACKLFLVHPGGGTLLNYVHLVRHLAAEVPIYGLQARGLDGHAEAWRDLEEMAAHYVEEICAVQPEGPYLLAGHSLGGVIAYEMARRLEERGKTVGLLALFDAAASRQVTGDALDERSRDAESLAEMADAIGRFSGKPLGLSVEALRQLDTDAQLEALVAALDRAGIALFGDTAQARRVLEVSKAHVQAGRGYRPRRSALPVTLYRAQGEPGAERAADRGGEAADETLGWSAVCETPVEVVWTAGDHVTMMGEPAVAALARSLRRRLAAAIEAAPAPA